MATVPTPMRTDAFGSPRAHRRADRTTALRAVGLMIAVMWAAEALDAVLPARLDELGIEPRDADGLTGVVLAPVLHAGFGHLLANTLPFAALGAVVALSGLRRLLAVTAIVALVSGLGVWLLAPATTLHVGASGIVFGYALFLVTRGLFARSLLQLAVGVVVVALFGGTLLLGLLPREGVSWEGHALGALGGILAARLLAGRRR